MTAMARFSVWGWLIAAALNGPLALAQESFQVNLAEDGETIGDMRPVFLKFRSQAMPAISPREVARRYQRLFDQSTEPEVRIDALNRLSNLQAASGEKLDLTPEQEQRLYRNAVDSYEMIVNSGAFQGRLDELLYQSAKAYAYIGQNDDSVERLEQLVGLYPSSALAPEARFRIAESRFASGRFSEAELGYQQVLAGQASDALKRKARYMLGWSAYKQGALGRAGDRFMDVLDEYAAESDNFRRVPVSAIDVVDDTFRIIALMVARSGGADNLQALLDRNGEKAWNYLLFDRLADFYAARQQYQRSVAVSEAFLARSPYHASAPAIRTQIVQVWSMAGDDRRTRNAMAAYVSAYRPDARYQSLAGGDQDQWAEYARKLADQAYYQATHAGSGVGREVVSDQFRTAADLYQALAAKAVEAGAMHRLAGDAWLQAGEDGQALTAFEQAGYDDPRFEGAAEAAWAGIKLRIQRQDDASTREAALTELTAAADRFAERFPSDTRVPALQADLGNRLSAAGEPAQAARFAELAVAHPGVTSSDAYSAWLVLGQARMGIGEYRSAEQAWRQALDLGKPVNVTESDRRDIRQQLATSIYRQGEMAMADGDVDHAVANFQRIVTVYPGSPIARKGRYDAATALLQAQRWQPAINALQRFRADYPDDPLTASVSDKLVLAYESSQQPVRAADELIQAAGPQDWQKRLRAAALYDQAGENGPRNQLYKAYLTAVTRPADANSYLHQQRMRRQLIESGAAGDAMRQDMVARELASDWHSKASLQSAAAAALTLARQADERFAGIRLTLPLKASLGRKKAALEDARQRYHQAEDMGDDRTRSEALFRRAELSRQLADDIVDSERPAGLTELEQSQYQLLLEEQAYPFEDQAIRIHAQNHHQLADGIYNVWVQQSIDELAKLFPGRYARDSRWIGWNQEAGDGA